MSELHEATFVWPRTDAKDVVVTGSFDQWSHSLHLQKGPSGFAAKVHVPWSQKIFYKFLVDGQWLIQDGAPTEYDHIGNVNNVYQSPPKPALATALDPIASDGIDLSMAAGTATNAASDALARISAAVQQASSILVVPAVEAVTAKSEAPSNGLEASGDVIVEANDKPNEIVEEEKPIQNGHIPEKAVIDTPTTEKQAAPEMTVEAILPTLPQPLAPEIPISILPVADASQTMQTDNAAVNTTANQEISTHTPAAPAAEGLEASAIQADITTDAEPPIPSIIAAIPAEEVSVTPAVEETPVSIPKPASPQADKTEPASVSPKESSQAGVVFPGAMTPGRSSPAPPVTPAKSTVTNGSTTTPGSGPTTPIKHRFPTDDMDDSTGSIRSKGSFKRKKRTSSIFGKIKSVFSHHKENSEHA